MEALNEEKAKEIGRKWYFDNTQSNEAAYKGALMMAKWKDQQFQEFIDSLGVTVSNLYEENKMRRSDDSCGSTMLKRYNDEIRKNLIEFVKEYGDNFYGQVAKSCAINWLETLPKMNLQNVLKEQWF